MNFKILSKHQWSLGRPYPHGKDKLYHALTYSLYKGLEYSQQSKISLSVIDENEWFLRKGYPFPMLAMELFTKEWKEKDNLNR